MGLDPEFIKKIQEKKAKREALEKKYAHQPARKTGGGSRSGGTRKTGPIYRSVSMLSGEEVVISGEEAKKRAQKAEYNG
jgi:hypothetical protein